ncbi:MAG: hypothetical protein P8K77_00885 [Polaribacter sp.]|nr:hypothetical protein [Polaribacter sp.]
MYKIKKITLFFVGFLFLLVENVAAQCAMCKAVVESGGEEMAESLNSGITYLMVFPYVLVGVLAYFLYKYKKRTEN